MRTKPFRPLTLTGIALAVLGLFIVLSLVPPPVEAQSASHPVRNLTLTKTSDTSIQVTWDAPAAPTTVISYTVDWNGPNTGNSGKLRPIDRSYSINNLSPGTYTVSVSIWWFTQGGTSSDGYVDPVSGTITLGSAQPPDNSGTQPQPQPPDNSGAQPQPDSLRLTQTTIDSISVEWNAPASGTVTYYSVEWSGPRSGSERISYQARAYKISNLSHGTYEVSVRARIVGEPALSDHVSGTIAVSDGRPENLTITRISDEAITVTWDHPTYSALAPSAISYHVSVKDARTRVEVATDSIFYSDNKRNSPLSGLTDDTNYTVSVNARMFGRDYASATVHVTTLPTPGTVAGLSAEGIVNGLSVSWTERPASEKIFAYEIDYSRDGNSYNAPNFNVWDVSSATIESLAPGQEQKVRIRACGFSKIAGDGFFCSPWSETTGTPLAPASALMDAPGAPQNLALTLTEDGRLKVKWDAPATGWDPAKMEGVKVDDHSYQFRYEVRLQDTETGQTVYKRPGHKKQQVIFRNLKDGVTYQVSMQAKIKDAQRVKAEPHHPNSHWVKSEWVSATITVPEQGEGGESPQAGIGEQPFRLIWVELQPGEPTPPNAVGEATKHMRQIPGTQIYERFYPATECRQYETSSGYFSAAADEIFKARNQASALAAAEEDLQRQKDFRTDTLAEAGTNATQQLRDYLDGRVASAQNAVDAARALLNTYETELGAKCDELFPADEGLTQADQRWVQVPAPIEEVQDEE